MAKTPEPEEVFDAATRAVVTVGAGRGFIIETTLGRFPVRLIVTAAHCLPRLPPALATAHAEERTYPELLGPLGKRRPKVWAECEFVDPVADIAVLASPDGQVHYDEEVAYDELTEGAPILRIVDAPGQGPVLAATRADVARRNHAITASRRSGRIVAVCYAGGARAGGGLSPIFPELC